MGALICLFILACVRLVSPIPVNTAFGMSYLQKHAYIGADSPNPRMARSGDPETLRKAIIDFQDMAGIPQTGILDRATLEMMSLPRCGNPDRQNMGDGDTKRKKRYAVVGNGWNKNVITYRIQIGTRDMSPADLETEIKRAFKAWSDVSPLRFVQTTGRADIEIKFVNGEHGDGHPFDGPGNVLAHAFFPLTGGTEEIEGDAHFDDQEYFTFNRSVGIDVFQVAAHEFGHSLGLSHSRVQSALMAPFYRGFVPNFKLHSDDIEGIQKLYGPNRPIPTPRSITTSPRPRTTPPIIRDLCDAPKIDAAIYLHLNDRTYVFIGDVYYRLNFYGADPGYPRKISLGWSGVPGYIDAALSSPTTAEIYLFKGAEYWKFIGGYRSPGYPKRIGTDGFYDLPENIDNALVWSGNGRVYFMKGYQYYRLGTGSGEYETRRIDPYYPKSLSVWGGLPANVDASVQWSNKRTYFFIGDEYYRFNDTRLRVESDYPKPTNIWWFGCR